MPVTASDEEVLRFAHAAGHVLLTCNRDDFLALTDTVPNSGIIILIRRRTRALEKAALIRLLSQAGNAGILSNINFA